MHQEIGCIYNPTEFINMSAHIEYLFTEKNVEQSHGIEGLIYTFTGLEKELSF